MWIEALKRFNHHNPGTVFEADDKDAKKWVKNGLAKEAKKPPEDKMAEKAAVTK